MADPVLQWAKRNQPRVIRLIRELVEIESPSDAPEAVERCMDWLAEHLRGLGAVRREQGSLHCSFRLQGRREGSGTVLALGHADTVWPLGTLRTMKFRRAEGRLWGPGVLDMKAGLVFFIHAMLALRELDIPVAHDVVLLVTPDEETGSRKSRALTTSASISGRLPQQGASHCCGSWWRKAHSMMSTARRGGSAMGRGFGVECARYSGCGLQKIRDQSSSTFLSMLR